MNTAFTLPPFWTAQTLTQLKIYLRTKRPPPARPEESAEGVWSALGVEDPAGKGEDVSEGIGRNEGTVRFLWDKQEIAVA